MVVLECVLLVLQEHEQFTVSRLTRPERHLCNVLYAMSAIYELLHRARDSNGRLQESRDVCSMSVKVFQKLSGSDLETSDLMVSVVAFTSSAPQSPHEIRSVPL